MPNLEEIRIILDQYTETIISRLKDRSRYELNNNIYVPGAVKIEGREGISFLEFALGQKERYYAALGRYGFSDQTRIVGGTLPPAQVERIIRPERVVEVNISLGEKLIDYYIHLLRKICHVGDAPDTYGTSVDLDTEVLENINARINIGRHVADVKVAKYPCLLGLVSKPQELRARLTMPQREEMVVDEALEAAGRYEGGDEGEGRGEALGAQARRLRRQEARPHRRRERRRRGSHRHNPERHQDAGRRGRAVQERRPRGPGGEGGKGD